LDPKIVRTKGRPKNRRGDEVKNDLYILKLRNYSQLEEEEEEDF
jgi:hypothetical protein